MIERYTLPEIGEVWTEEAKYRTDIALEAIELEDL